MQEGAVIALSSTQDLVFSPVATRVGWFWRSSIDPQSFRSALVYAGNTMSLALGIKARAFIPMILVLW